jgi:hypothetical protein
MSNQDSTPSRSPESYDPDFTQPEGATPAPHDLTGDDVDARVAIVDDVKENQSDSENPIAEQRSKRPDPNEEGRPAQAIVDSMRKEEAAEYSGMEPAEPQPAFSAGDLDNTPRWDFGQPGTPVKDIANGIAGEPDLPELPKDHPAYLLVEEEKLRRAGRDADVDPAVLGS